MFRVYGGLVYDVLCNLCNVELWVSILLSCSGLVILDLLLYYCFIIHQFSGFTMNLKLSFFSL